MKPRILAIAGSPRRQGNTEILLDHAIAGAESAGAQVEKLVVPDMSIAPCNSCGACLETGACPIEDDMAELYHHLLTCQGLVVATPVYFYGLPAQLKAAIDRCQALWARRDILGESLREPGGRALLISAGGTGGNDLFTGVEMTMNLIFRLLGLETVPPVLVRRVDEKGEVLQRPDALKLARARGAKLLTLPSQVPG